MSQANPSVTSKSLMGVPSLPDTASAVGVDIGGTKIVAGCVNAKTGLGEVLRRPTPKNPTEFIDTLAELINASKTGEPAAQAVGIATAGMVNHKTGEIIGSTGNLPAAKTAGKLKALLEDRVQLPVHVENDANAAAYGEAKLGSAQGYDNVLMITLGTGVGAGIIMNGQLLRGSHFAGAEAGHIFVSLSPHRQGTCGKFDTWEAYASGPGLAQTALEYLDKDREKHTVLTSPVGTHELVEAWAKGDELALDLKDVWLDHVGIGLASLLNVLDPDITVIGGGMGPFVDYDVLNRHMQPRLMYKTPKIVPAQLGNKAGMIGAASFALETIYGRI
ncbi:MAG: ROK family protein [Cyanobacteria bacterium HKST-UBA03]|nr:ROK family protein [Cyanobacteria bacterium HKST-UBA03]